MSKILITGANGLIGSHIVEYFIQKGKRPACLVRKTSNLDNLKELKVNLLYADITNYQNLKKTFKNFNFIIHTAALTSDWGSYDQFYNINVTGTLNVLKAAHANKISNVIITGSISSYGEENCPQKKNETYKYNSHYKYFLDGIFPSGMNYYRDTKALATRKAIDFAGKNKINLTIIEPAWVYGEREFHSGFYTYLKAVSEGNRLLPGSKKNNYHVIYARELARAYYLAYTKKIKGIERIIIGNKNTDKMHKIYSLFCKEAGFKKVYYLPKFLIYPAGFILELFYTIFKIKSPPLLSRARINMFYDNIEYSVEKAKKLLNFETAIPLEKSIKSSVKWYKNKGLL